MFAKSPMVQNLSANVRPMHPKYSQVAGWHDRLEGPQTQHLFVCRLQVNINYLWTDQSELYFPSKTPPAFWAMN